MSDIPIQDGRSRIDRDGFSYLPRFITKDESESLISYFASIKPLWEDRYRDQPDGAPPRKLTRPVYWLGGWQFACHGYYSEPDHTQHRCVRAEPFPEVMQNILERLKPLLSSSHPCADPRLGEIPNTCLINYYGRKMGQGVPVDVARLRMHRDHEPGPVIMFCVGQPGLLEFIDPDLEAPEKNVLSLWTRHRSICILSGKEYKDRLYHQIRGVRTGDIPHMPSPLPDFELRRVSISFRHVPPKAIGEYNHLPQDKQRLVLDYMETLAESSATFAEQLEASDD